jgi:hypothetical protein
VSAIVAVLWVLVFGLGVAAGVALIIALSALRRDHRDRDEPPAADDDQWRQRDHGATWP